MDEGNGVGTRLVESVAEGKPAESDGTLGMEVVKVIYSAYLSAVEGKRVDLS